MEVVSNGNKNYILFNKIQILYLKYLSLSKFNIHIYFFIKLWKTYKIIFLTSVNY